MPAWHSFAMAFDSLRRHPPTSGTISQWLARWSDAEKAIWEARAGLKRIYLRDETDETAHTAYQTFMADVFPAYHHAQHQLIALFLALPDYQPTREQLQFTRRWRADAVRFQEANLALEGNCGELLDQYHARVWALRVPFRSESLTMEQMRSLPLPDDPAERQALWHASNEAWRSARTDLDVLQFALLRTRHQIARNAGFPHYLAYRWDELARFDFTSEDLVTFYDALLASPLLNPPERSSSKLPWDLCSRAETESEPRIFTTDDDLVRAVAHIGQALDPELGALIARMRAAGTIDVGRRPGKASGGEEWLFPASKLPCIRATTTGTATDALLVLHELGHAWHDYLSLEEQALFWNASGPDGFGEFPSVSLPFLALAYSATHADGIIPSHRVAALVLQEYIRIFVHWLPHVVRMDRFQLWLYAQDPALLTPADLDTRWLDLSRACYRGVDWTGCEAAVAAGWRAASHAAPLYFAEYALAQIAALCLFARAQTDLHATWQDFRAALSAGNSLPLPELYRLAGIAVPYSTAAIQTVSALALTLPG